MILLHQFSWSIVTYGATLMSGLATKLRLGQDHGIKLELKKNFVGASYWGGITLCKSNSSGCQYVSLQSKIRERKVETCGLAQQKWFWASIFAHFAEARKENCKRGV
jgi:hypothetical protein